MQAIEFEATPLNGAVSIPVRYRHWEGRKVKVIFLAEEDIQQTADVSSWRERMSLIPVLKTTPEQLLESVADDWEAYL